MGEGPEEGRVLKGKKRDLERKGVSLGQLCWLLQALLTQQKDRGKGKKRRVKAPPAPAQLSVLAGHSIVGSHRLASKEECAMGQQTGSLSFP